MSVFGYGLEPYGYGPYGGLGGVSLPPTVPPLGGYGGYSYGYGPYGSLGGFGKPSIAVTGGYGGCAYGTGPYGCIDSLGAPPEVIAAVSITGFIIEVFFSQEMSPDADLFDPASYTLIDITGAAPATVLSVQVGVEGTWGPTSVILNHTGTTLGGLYRVVVSGPRDIGGTSIAAYAPLNQAEVLCKGEPPPFTITPISGTELLYEFDYDMLDEAGFSPGIEELDAYGFITTYPQNILPQLVTFPYNANLQQMKMDVIGMTSAEYAGVVSPATAIDYDATYLPNAAQADFTSQELGSGTTTQGTDEVLLSKQIGFAYGWRFLDTSGRLIPGSSYRVDVTFDASTAVKIDPEPSTDPVVLILVNDGAVQVTLAFKRVAGVDTLEIDSGAFNASSSIDWTSEEVTVSLVRNQKADTYTVVVNEEPIVSGLTASFTAPPGFPAGVQFHLDPAGIYEIVDFPLRNLLFTATQTIFSAAWNFLHNQTAPFTGSAANAKDFLLTKKGPLVKGWGDATPATKQDVVVYVNGTPVEVESVNPYYGKIFLTIPIPLMPPGTMDVAVDYLWFPTPIMAMAGLNTLGLVLNKYDCKPLCPEGGNSSGVGLPGGGTNGIEFSRFPMGIVLGPGGPDTRLPLLRSPRFIAYQQQYTAALNSPTTLLLNRNPHQVALSDEGRDVSGNVVFYEGTESPGAANPPWGQVGEDEYDSFDQIVGNDPQGIDNVGALPPNVNLNSTDDGVFQIYKVISGSYGEGNVTFYTQEIETDFPSTITMVARFQVLPSTNRGTDIIPPDVVDPTPIPDGVFVGVGFGCHTNNHLYLVGTLLINEVQHLGMLVDPAFPELAESWQLAYQTPIEIIDPTTFRTDSDAVPRMVRERLVSDDLVRFQIVDGTQAGVYEVIEIVDQSDGTSTVSIDGTNPFPADPSVYGNRDFTAVFEQRWDGDGQPNRPVTYRLIIKNDVKGIPEGFAELFVGGSLSGLALTLDGAPPFAIPPDGVLLYPTGNSGEVFWGSLDRRAENLSNWHFMRYGLDPGATSLNFRQIVVAAEMNDLPEDDPNNIWFLTQEFGSRIIDATGDQILLKATSSNEEEGVEGQDLSIGYSRIEPFLTRRMAIDVDTTFLVDSGVLGAGDLIYSVKDGLREVRLATLLYEETATLRRLLYLESVSLSGLLLPEQQGWTTAGELTVERVQGHRMQYQQVAGETLLYTTSLLDPGATELASDSRIFEMRATVGVASTTDVDGDTGIFFGSDVGPIGSAQGVGLQLRVAAGGNPDQVFLFSLETGIEAVAFDVDWNDGEIHTYRVLADTDTNTVSVVVDDVVLGTADLALFAFSSTDADVMCGFASPLADLEVEIDSFSVVVAAPSTAKRTIGVWLGGDVSDINEWRIPRTDGTSVLNSNLSATVEEMDWTQRIRARIHRDPGWGVTILRPDLPPPPSFTGDFATQFTEPSAGWINVEYRDLPRVGSEEIFGQVSFGALDPASISQTRIDEVRYRIYKYASEDIIMPPHMVLNQYNVITSGEFQNDVTLETVTVTSENNVTVSLAESNITADRVFQLVAVNSNGSTTTYVPPSFEFDKATQTITLTTNQYFNYADFGDDPYPQEDGVFNSEFTNEDLLLPSTFGPDAADNVKDPDRHIESLEPTKISVTVTFAPGKPLTKTYLCSQPLLDGTTLLNEGTPPYELAQVAKATKSLMWGSRINDPNDVLNTDPDFILNDPFRFLGFTQDSKIQYEEIDFCEVAEGEVCRLSPFCDDNVPGAGEAGNARNDPGDIGNGLINVGFEGVAFTETEPISFSDGPSDGFGGFTGTQFLEYSGGDENAGGNLNEAILFTPLGPNTPSFESPDGSVGWSVFGQLYDTTTNTTTNLFFGTGGTGP
jgi:hypothetical protein